MQSIMVHAGANKNEPKLFHASAISAPATILITGTQLRLLSEVGRACPCALLFFSHFVINSFFARDTQNPCLKSGVIKSGSVSLRILHRRIERLPFTTPFRGGYFSSVELKAPFQGRLRLIPSVHLASCQAMLLPTMRAVKRSTMCKDNRYSLAFNSIHAHGHVGGVSGGAAGTGYARPYWCRCC